MSQGKPFIVDGHSDFVSRIVEQRSRGNPGALRAEYLPALSEGNVRLAIMQVGSDSSGEPEPTAIARALEKISYLSQEIAACAGIRLLRTVQDLDDLLAGDDIGIVFMFEGGKVFADTPAYVSVYHQLGVRMAALTWNNRNLLADGAAENRTGGGLSTLGVEVVKEMGRHNMVLDVSHLSDAGIWDALRVARGPVVASHANARSLCPHVRNLTDDQIRAIAETGGLIGVNFFPRLLRESGPAEPDDVVRHLDHIIELTSEDAVGFGPDFIDYLDSGVLERLSRSSVGYGSEFRYPVGLESTRDLRNLPELLRRAGYSPTRIEKALGLNWVRVLRYALQDPGQSL